MAIEAVLEHAAAEEIGEHDEPVEELEKTVEELA